MWCVDRPRSGLATLAVAVVLSALAGCATVAKPVEVAPKAAAAVATPGTVAAAVTAKPAAPVIAPVAAAVQAQFERALQAQRAGRHDEAERQWRALAQAHPDLGGVHANLGLIQRGAGRTAEAVTSLERAVQLSPTQPRFFNELGIAYRANGQFTQAEQAYERALTLDANHAAALLNLGILHDLYLGNGAKALALYDRYLALTQAGDATVTKWATDLRRRNPATPSAPGPVSALAAKSGKEVQ